MHPAHTTSTLASSERRGPEIGGRMLHSFLRQWEPLVQLNWAYYCVARTFCRLAPSASVPPLSNPLDTFCSNNELLSSVPSQAEVLHNCLILQLPIRPCEAEGCQYRAGI